MPASPLLPVAACLGILSTQLVAADMPRVTLGGEVGHAAATSAARFRFAPFDSLPWLRADLTDEKVTAFDETYGHVMRRPFKHYSGDISGRFIEIMAMNSRGNPAVHPALKGLLGEVPRHQRPGGYFCASGVVDWQDPLDYVIEGDRVKPGRMLPALWGNSRMLCGLVEAARAFPAEADLAAAARRLGDFYVSVLPRFNDPARMAEYTGAGTYASGYVTCWFPAMEGLARLSLLTGERKYLEAAMSIADFYRRFDRVPIDHAHGMLCGQVSLLLLFEATGDPGYLARVEKRWDELVEGGYVNPAGGILEKCHLEFSRDEGCAIADWLRLSLALGDVTGKARYWAMAERTLHNHFLQNQTSRGGFGHRHVLCDGNGVYGFRRRNDESTWCCSFHGELGFIHLRNHLLQRDEGVLSCRFALDFTAEDAVGTTVSVLRAGRKAGEVVRQRLSLAGQPATVVRIRRPHWADRVTAVDAGGEALPLEADGGWCATRKPVGEVEFVYSGGIYAEDRRCRRLPDGPRAGKPFVLGHGPKLLAAEGDAADGPAWPTTLEALEAHGLQPLSFASRHKDRCFVMAREN